MKQIFTIVIALLVSASAWAQSPQKMSYQAVIRNSSDALVSNQSVGMQVSILQGSATGTSVYSETHTPTSNANGLVSIEIGAGNAVSGNYAAINWADGPYFIRTETDPAGGTNYTISGTSQLLTVPFAHYADVADSISGGITYSETDPVYSSSIASAITAADTANWNNDMDTQLDSTDIANFGFITEDTNTQLDSADIANLGFVAGPHPVIKSSGASAFLTGQFTMPGSTAKIEFDTTDFDLQGEFNTIANRFIANDSGLYHVDVSLAIDAGLTTSYLYFIKVRVNGSDRFQFTTNDEVTLSPVVHALSKTIQLSANDVVEVWMFTNNPGPLSINPDPTRTYFSLVKVN